MRKRKLYHALVLLGKEEREKFSHFLASPYLNTSNVLIQFWEQWQAKVLSAPPDLDISEKDFVKGSALKMSRIDSLCWELMVKVRQFLALQAYFENPDLENVLYAKWMVEVDPTLEAYERFIPQVVSGLEEGGESPEKYLALFYEKAHLGQAKITSRMQETDWRAEFEGLDASLQEFSQLKGLQLACGAANAGGVFSINDEESAEPFYLRHLKHPPTADANLLVRLYWLTLALLVGDGGAAGMAQIVVILQSHRDRIVPEVRNEIFGYTLNYGIRQINHGDEDYMRHTFDLYRLLVKHGDLLENGQISPQQYKNLVTLACRVAELGWAGDFIEEYAGKLADNHDGLAREYNLAVLYFHQARYPEAISLLKEVLRNTRHDIFYGIDGRAYLWKSYFEHLDQLSPSELDEMYRLHDSFRVYLSRQDRLSPLHQTQYGNFIKLFRRFIKSLEDPDQKRRRSSLLSLQKKLHKMDGVANRMWFAQKLETAISDSAVGDPIRKRKSGPPPLEQS